MNVLICSAEATPAAPSCPSLHPKKAADFSAALLVFRLASAFSVAIGADSDADAGRADADAATFLIAVALDMTLAAGSISV
jgi:hypothetical protein